MGVILTLAFKNRSVGIKSLLIALVVLHLPILQNTDISDEKVQNH